MRAVAQTLAALILAAGIVAQDLPPGILLLSRVKRQLEIDLQRLPNVRCLETIERQHQPAHGRMSPLDTVRLEVLTNGNAELYSSPGDRKFSERHPINYAGSGTLSNGIFGLYLKDILLSGYARETYGGEAETSKRLLARYDYRLPLPWSGQKVGILEGSGRVGLRGSYWADTQSNDVVRLEIFADEIPPALPLRELYTGIDYARTDLGNGFRVLLPTTAELRMIKLSGESSVNRMTFTGCRAYSAQSTIDFAAPGSVEETPRFATSAVDDTLRSLPPGLRIAVKLETRLSGDMAVGALIDGVVTADGSAHASALVPPGSPVRGRIRRIDRFSEPFRYFIVGFEYTEVEVDGIRYRFHADAVEIQAAHGVERNLSIPDPLIEGGAGSGRLVEKTETTLTFAGLPGVATFFYKGSRLDLPRGFRTTWITLP